MAQRANSDSIGLSGHKNEYRSGVRIANWVEDQFGAEHASAPTMVDMESTMVPKAVYKGAVERTKVMDPKPDEHLHHLFSHGPSPGEPYYASMSNLHYTDPTTREYGAKSDQRVHKSQFFGSKHVDAYVPFCDPNPRLGLMTAKAAQWQLEAPPKGAAPKDMYATTAGDIGSAL